MKAKRSWLVFGAACPPEARVSDDEVIYCNEFECGDWVLTRLEIMNHKPLSLRLVGQAVCEAAHLNDDLLVPTGGGKLDHPLAISALERLGLDIK
jgi:hypothetical protein